MTSKNNEPDAHEVADLEDAEALRSQGYIFAFAGVFCEFLFIVFFFYETPSVLASAINKHGMAQLFLLATLASAAMATAGLLCYLEGDRHAE